MSSNPPPRAAVTNASTQGSLHITLFSAGFLLTSNLASHFAPNRRMTTQQPQPQRASSAQTRRRQFEAIAASRTDLSEAVSEYEFPEDVSHDTKLEALSDEVKDMQEEARVQVYERIERNTDRKSLEYLEAANEAKKEKSRRRSMRKDRESLAVLEHAPAPNIKIRKAVKVRKAIKKTEPEPEQNSTQTISTGELQGFGASPPAASPSISALAEDDFVLIGSHPSLSSLERMELVMPSLPHSTTNNNNQTHSSSDPSFPSSSRPLAEIEDSANWSLISKAGTASPPVVQMTASADNGTPTQNWLESQIAQPIDETPSPEMASPCQVLILPTREGLKISNSFGEAVDGVDTDYDFIDASQEKEVESSIEVAQTADEGLEVSEDDGYKGDAESEDEQSDFEVGEEQKEKVVQASNGFAESEDELSEFEMVEMDDEEGSIPNMSDQASEKQSAAEVEAQESEEERVTKKAEEFSDEDWCDIAAEVDEDEAWLDVTTDSLVVDK